jgi:hypothetical protein
MSASPAPSEVPSFNTLFSGLIGFLFSTIVTVVITVLLTFLVQNYLSRPQIKGNILNVIRATWVSTAYGQKSSFWIYVYLTNHHKNSIAIIDYKCEADFGNGFVKLERVYGDVSKVLPPSLSVQDSSGKAIQLTNLGKHLLYKNAKPVRYGEFNHGFVMFSADISLANTKVTRYKFTCIDSFNNKHTIYAEPDKFMNFNLLLELLDIIQ